MDIRQLSYFVEVAHQQSFTKAAKTLNISQPALSKCISNLEEEFNVTLFTRSIGSISLTEEGHYVLENAVDLLFHFNEVENRLYDLGKKSNDSIAIGCSFLLQPIAGIDQLEKICKQHNISIYAYGEGYLVQLLENLYKGKIDLAICILCQDKVTSMNKVNKHICFSGHFIAIAPMGMCDDIHFYEDLQLPHKVITTYEFSAVIENYTKKTHTIYFMDSIEETFRRVCEKQYVAIIPDIYIQNKQRDFHVLQFKTSMPYEIALITDKGGRHSRAVKQIKAAIISEIKKQPLQNR